IFDAALVDKNRTKLIQSVTLVMAIADELRQRGMIHPEIYNKIKAAGTSQDQMRELYNSLTTREVKFAFYKILKEIDLNPK
uniref:CARD domain-containing protein n=1 Tax=Pundamilia nyererei TaxID=303518 RepID=A0A3B4H401_9CICH